MLHLLGLAGVGWFVYAAFFSSFFTPGIMALCIYGTCVVVTQLVLLSPGEKV